MADDTETDSKTDRRLTEDDWSEIVATWELGKARLSDLAGEYGVSEAAISKGLKKRGAVKGRRAHEIRERASEAATETAAEKTAEKTADRLERLNQTKDEHYKWSRIIAQMTMNRIAQAQKEGRAISTENAELKTLDIAAKTLSRTREERFHALDYYSEDAPNEDVPELQIRQLTDEEAEEHAGAPAEDDELGEEGEAAAEEIAELDAPDDIVTEG